MSTYYSDLNQNNQLEEQVQIKKFFARMLDFWILITISVALSLAIAWAINKFAPPTYRASSSVLIKDDSKRPGSGRQANFLAAFDIFRTQQNLQNEMGILQSNLLNQQTVFDLNLYIKYMTSSRFSRQKDVYNNTPFFIVLDTAYLQLINVNIDFEKISNNKIKISYTVPSEYSMYNYSTNKTTKGNLSHEKDVTAEVKLFHNYKDDFFSFRIVPNEKYVEKKNNSNYFFRLVSADLITQSYKSRLSVEPIDREATLVKLSITDQVPQRAENYLNMLMSNYIDMSLAEKNLQAEKTIEFIDSQLAGITDSLQQVEGKLEEFRTDHNITDLSFQGQAIYQKIQELEYDRAMEQLKVGYYEYLLKYVNEDFNANDLIAPSAVGITDPFFNQLILEFAKLFATREQLRMTSTEKNPFILELSKQIESVRKTITENVRNSLRNAKFVLSEKEKQINEIKNELSVLPKTERQYIQIQRMFTINDQIYTFLLEKRSEAAISRASNISDNQVIDVARVSGKIKPKVKLNYLIALLLGLIIPAIIIVSLDQLRSNLSDFIDIERNIKLPILGNILHDEGGGNNIESISGKVVESFRTIRTNLDFFSPHKENKIFAISSVKSGEGKTFTAFHLAYVFALAGKKTILIGGDIRKPDMGNFFNINQNKGLSTFLSRRDKWEDVVNKSKVENLDFVISGPVPPNPAELLSNENVNFILSHLNGYDIIVFDTAPIGIIADSAYILKKSDVVLYVVRYNVTSKNDLKVISQIIEKLKIASSTIICNDLKRKSRRYNYNYYYYSK